METPITPINEPLLAKQSILSKEEKEEECDYQQEKQVKVLCGYLTLSPTISSLNFYSYIALTLYKCLVLLPIYMINSSLLTYTYHLNIAQQDNLSSLNQTISLVIHLLIGSYFGYLCDRFGRKPLLVIGIIIESGCTVLMPNLPGVYPWYVLLHIVQGLGGLSSGAPPLLADYIDYESKGRGASLIGVLFYAGIYIAQMINTRSNLQTDLSMKFYKYGTAGLVIGLTICLGLKGGMYHKNLYHDKKFEKAKKSLAPQYSKVLDGGDVLVDSKEICVTSKERLDSKHEILVIPEEADYEEVKTKRGLSKEITKANTNGFESDKRTSSDGPTDPIDPTPGNINNTSIVVEGNQSPKNSQVRSRRASTVQVEKIKPGFITGLKQAKNPWILIGFVLGFITSTKMGLHGIILQTYIAKLLGKENAVNETMALTSNQTLTGLICIIFLGYVADKANKMYLIWFALLSSIVAVILLLMTPTVTNWMIYSSMVLFGMSSSAFMTVNGQLISKYADPRYRASVAAVAGIISMVGGNVTSIFGVYISQFDQRIPFLIYLSVASIGTVVLFVIYQSKKKFLNNI